MKRFKIVVALLCLVLSTSCVAEKIREQQTKFCADLATLSNTIAVMRRVVSASDTTIASLRQAEGQIREALRTVKASVRDEQETEFQEIETAYKDLDESVKKIPDQATVAQIREIVLNKVEILDTTLSKKKSVLKCSQS